MFTGSFTLKYAFLCLLVFSLAGCVFGPDRDPIETYEFYPNAKVASNGYDIEQGDAFVISVAEGMGGSKSTSAHGFWDTIYLVLPEEPRVGVTQTAAQVFRNGYRRWGSFAVDPDVSFEVHVEPLKVRPPLCVFKIIGTVPLRKYESLKRFRPVHPIEGDQYGQLDNMPVVWRQSFDTFKFIKDPYECHRGTFKSPDD